MGLACLDTTQGLTNTLAGSAGKLDKRDFEAKTFGAWNWKFEVKTLELAKC